MSLSFSQVALKLLTSLLTMINLNALRTILILYRANNSTRQTPLIISKRRQFSYRLRQSSSLLCNPFNSTSSSCDERIARCTHTDKVTPFSFICWSQIIITNSKCVAIVNHQTTWEIGENSEETWNTIRNAQILTTHTCWISCRLIVGLSGSVKKEAKARNEKTFKAK